ncbi:MAG: AAA family ATPase [Saccharofermentanales bacterium]
MNNVLNIKILSGIPASGKSTWAKNYILNNKNTVRINRDDLRFTLFNGVFTDGNESFVNKSKLSLIKTSLEFDRNLILDDTHCYNDYLVFLIDYIRDLSIELNKGIFIELLDFNVDINICIERNSKRDKILNNNILYHMYKSKKEIIIEKLNIDKYIKMSDTGH